MTKESLDTEVAILKSQREQMASDINELKHDVKQIKEFLMGENPKIVTKKEFDVYKANAGVTKWIIGIVTAVITSFVVLEITKVFK